MEEREGEGGVSVEEVPGDEGVVGGDVALGHGVEHLAGARDVAPAREPSDARVRGEDRRRGARRAEADRGQPHLSGKKLAGAKSAPSSSSLLCEPRLGTDSTGAEELIYARTSLPTYP